MMKNMGSYYKKRKGAGGPRHVTHAPWMYHTTLPDLLPSVREQGLRPLRDVASRLARDAAEKAAADAGDEVDAGFVHLEADERALGVALLCREVAVLRVRTSGVAAAFLTRDPQKRCPAVPSFRKMDLRGIFEPLEAGDIQSLRNLESLHPRSHQITRDPRHSR